MANNAVRLIAPVLLGALILLFPADGLRALGLGEARVDSWLGQPLDVSIRLLEVESQAIESVSVGPASLEDFERLGVPSQSLGLGLEVTVDRSMSPPVVRVRSQRPVRDPVVQILIDARWSSGRVLREYTLFLDPPVRESAAPAREVSQPAAEPRTEPASEPAAAPAEQERQTRRPVEPAEPAQRPASSKPAEQPTDPAPASRGSDSVAVSDGDTLWSIAQDWRPDSSLSMDQVMLAIFNRNREAFQGENINRLRSGAELDMPGVDDARAVDRADAERRVREHMRAWQPAVAEDVPVVSDAAMPESAASQPDDMAEAPDEPAEDERATAAEDDGEFRLDVVPPEDDQYSESSAVAEGEIQRVSDQLAEVEEAIIAEDLDNPAFDEHVAEVRDALERRDMAGLAVAEESLAELEARLREAREARAEQERLAQSDGGEQATDSEEGDQIADYMSELEEEFGAGEGDAADPDADADEAMAEADGAADDGDEAAGDTDAADAAAPDEQAADEQADELAAGEQAEAGMDEAGDEAGDEQEAQRPMTVTRTSSSGLMAWLWPALGILLVVVLGLAALVWLRRRREDGGRSEPTLGGSDAVDSARASVARNPDDLAAHLALLKVLADEGREQEFTDAFDQMYQEVDDESAPEWQEALSLASVHVPDHPLLTPRESSLDEDEDFDRRADEMFGMLDVDESESDEPARLDSDESEADEEIFNLGAGDEEAERAPQGESDRDKAESGREDTFDEDMDLAVLSERLDDPSKEPGSDHSLDEDRDDADFGSFKEIDEYSVGDATDAREDEHSEAPVELEDDNAPEPDLDLESSREQEADEVFGESGTRETEDLDFELSSDVEDVESSASEEGLDFDLGEAPGTAGEPSEAEAGDETPKADDSLEPAEPEATEEPAAAGGSLSDEDADVKLDLARAYISVDLADSARSVLEEVISDGSEDKRAEAKKLLDSIV
ncbi:MAG: FimV/HubP family polar landmark protein [Xanthomonadales bacterium]|nr:FimV/HubP family polar landmark protein [Xanthomonadales bacterium]